ncbi:type II secretion system F family protein [Natronorubrum sp. A-ect3]|uniref:type II secretion system F family protein n=1 Tax=Natronorubrum sp. A-ect3 TaxID=3242698 RepID=UPI00359D3CC1
MERDRWCDDDQTPAATQISGSSGQNQSVSRNTETERNQNKLTDDYGRLRSYFKRHSGRYDDLQRRLKQARIQTTVDQYVAESAVNSLKAAVGSVLLATVVLTVGLSVAVFSDWSLGVTGNTLLETVGLYVAIISISALCCGGAVWVWQVHYQPRRLVTARRSEIELGLPSAVTFLYAMTGGGVDIITAIRSLADEKDVYGEIANEFDQLVREMDLFGNDFQTALRKTSEQTPSDNLQQFVDNLLGVLESGGDVSRFLEDEIEQQTELALQKQETFIERIGLLSEVFIAGFVAGPLFLIITLLVIGLLGGVSVLEIVIMIYVVLPLSAAGFFLLVDLFSQPRQLTPSKSASHSPQEIDHAGPEPSPDDPQLKDSTRYQAYQHSRLRTKLLERSSDVIGTVVQRPALGFLLTVPLGLLLAIGLVFSGTVQPTATAVVARPVQTTLLLVVLPGLVASVPVSVLYERNRRRERTIIDQFPDVLETLANANRMGVTLTAAFKLVSKAVTGPLRAELTAVRNDIVWNKEPSNAFRRLASRLPIPRVAPTLTIVARGNRISSDLHEVLEIAASELRIHARMESARRNEVSPYLAIVFIGSLIYLFVIVVLNVSFLEPMAEASVPETDEETVAPVALSIDVDIYRTVFFHSALIQGIVAGLIGGKLTENSLLSGLKYAIGLTVLITVVFFFV